MLPYERHPPPPSEDAVIVTSASGSGDVEVVYCPTDEMIADYNTKALVGKKFVKFQDLIMNLSNKPHLVGQQECVGKSVLMHMKLPTRTTKTDDVADQQN